MSISAIQGQAISGYTSSYSKRDNTTPDNAYINPAIATDRISFSEDARKLAQQQNQAENTINTNENSILHGHNSSSEETQNTNTRKSSIVELGKNSLLSMLLENLFFAALEENDADNGCAANGESNHAGGDGMQRQQPRDTKPTNSLVDNEKVSEIKKILTDVAKGKIELSDLPKAMAGGNSSGIGKSPKNEGQNTVKPSNSSKNKFESYI